MADQERSGTVDPRGRGVQLDRDGRIQPADSAEVVAPKERDTSDSDATVSGTATGTVAGAALGAVIGGPIGAVVGAVAGAASGKVAEEANREDPNVPTGNPTDSDQHRTKRDYFNGDKVYEQGSLEDVRRRD